MNEDRMLMDFYKNCMEMAAVERNPLQSDA